MGRNSIKDFVLASALSFSLLFPSIAKAEIRDIKYKGHDYLMDINRERKEYSIAPDMGEPIAKEMFASVWLDNIAENARTKNNALKSKLEDFIWTNPSEMQINSASQSLVVKQNIEYFFPYEIPKLNISAFKKGNEIYVKFGLASQNYLMQWYKDCSIIFFYPKDTKVKRLKFDRIYELSDEKDDVGRFKVKESSFPDEREVYGMGTELMLSKIINLAKEELAEELPEAQLLSIAMKLEDQLAKYSKREREKSLSNLKRDYDSFGWSPSPEYQPQYQTGRMACLGFDGRPESIYFFINVNITQNPLNQERGTATRKEGPLLELLLIKPSQVISGTPAGRIVNHGRHINGKIDGFLAEYESKRGNNLSFDNKSLAYERFRLWESQINPFINVLDAFIEKKIERDSDISAALEEFKIKAKQQQGMSLEQIISEYRIVRRKLTADEMEITELIKKLYLAYRNKDEKGYKDCFGKKYQGDASVNKTTGFGLAFPKKKYEYKVSLKDTTYFSDGVLGATFIETFIPSQKDTKNIQERKASYFFIKEDRRWKIKGDLLSVESFLE